MAQKNFRGKSGREVKKQDLEHQLMGLTGLDYSFVDLHADKFDKFTDMVINFCTKPKHRSKKQKVLDIARERCGYVGLKNFHRLAEFFREEQGENLEFKAVDTYSGYRHVMKELKEYLYRTIPEDAAVYMVSYERENGRMKKINDLFLHRVGSNYMGINEADFPIKGGILHVFVKEKDAEYAVSIGVGTEKRESFFDGRMHTFDYYVAVVKPLLKIDPPKKFKNIIAFQKDNQQA